MKVTLRKREVFEAEAALKILSEMDMGQKLAYAVAKNIRLISNEAQDIRTAIAMNKDKSQAASLFQEKRQIILQDATMPCDKRTQLMSDLENEFAGARNAMDDHNRVTTETLSENIELELFAMEWEWFPPKLKPNALGPMIECVIDNSTVSKEAVQA